MISDLLVSSVARITTGAKRPLVRTVSVDSGSANFLWSVPERGSWVLAHYVISVLPLIQEGYQRLPSLLVHLGPHKTGSTAIQRALANNSAVLREHGVVFLAGVELDRAAQAIARGQYPLAKQLLSTVAQAAMATKAERFVMSQEDFCGEIPGRGKVEAIYPTIAKNLRVISRVFASYDVSFLFFAREESDWIRSCFSQNLRYRKTLTTFREFHSVFGTAFSWDTVLEQARQQFGDRLEIQPYSREPTSGFAHLITRLGANIDFGALRPAAPTNVSPPEATHSALERINRFADMPSLATLYKKRFLENLDRGAKVEGPQWPPSISERHVFGLEQLAVRVQRRVPTQTGVPDLLPELSVNLDTLGHTVMDEDTTFPTASREDMNVQALKLKYRFRGKSALAFTNALAISYLRRDTEHTEKASRLFHRIWQEQGLVLVTELNTRWLISTLQTFLDHGENEHQKLIGAAGYFYANMLKIYEGERAIEGRPPDTIYDSAEPSTAPAVRGLDRFSVGGTDLLLNTNALALELAQTDLTAGLVPEEFLLRVSMSKTVFSRMDKSRIAHGIDEVGFKDAWSFFQRPD